MNFNQLQLKRPLLRAVADIGYTEPTPIQQKAIPAILRGRDIIGCAQTGTGKTAAFALPILQRLHQQPRERSFPAIRALILTPTRELAIQIDQSFTDYGRYLPLRHTVIYGGVGQNPQVEALRKGVDILVATPGRLNDLIGQGHIQLRHVEIFVLDEADRMLDMGFIHDVRRVIGHLPEKRQNLLFSATMPAEIAQLAQSMMHDPLTVSVTPSATPVEKIDQCVYFVERPQKRQLLPYLLKQIDAPSALVFTRTKHGADRVVKELSRQGISALAIHGNKSQSARQAALQQFKEHKIPVLVATDIAARGIDIEELSHVFNYDLPEVPETYVHRIGRTGRAGQSGKAISFCSTEERPYLKQIEKLIQRDIPVVDEHPFPADTETAAPKQPVAGQPARAGGRRPTEKAQPKKPDKAQRSRNRRTAKAAKSTVQPRPARAENAPASEERQTSLPRSKKRKRNDDRRPRRIFSHEINVSGISEAGGGYSRPSFYDSDR